MEKPIRQHFTLTCDHFRGHDTLNMSIILGFHWQMIHVESTSDVVHLHNIKQWEKVHHMTPNWGAEKFFDSGA